MTHRVNGRQRVDAASGDLMSTPRLLPFPGLVLDGPFPETKDLAYTTQAPPRVAEPSPVDLGCGSQDGAARRRAF